MAGWRPPSSAAVAAAAAVLLVSGCSMLRAAAPTDASPSASAPAVARASSPKASAAAASTSPRADEAGCVSAASQVHSGDLGLVAVGEYVYRSVDCAAPTGMGDQLAARAIVPEFTQMASQAGVSLQLQDTAGGTSLSLYADDGSCVLTVSERPRAKTLTCG